MSGLPCYVGLDVGGSTMKAGVVDDAGRLLGKPVSLPTEAHRGQELGLERMCETIRAAAAAAGVGFDRVAAVGVATPGLMDIPAGVILDPPHLKPGKNVPGGDPRAPAVGKPAAFPEGPHAAAPRGCLARPPRQG